MRVPLVDDLEDAARRARNGAALAAWRARRGASAAPAGAPEKETPATGAGVEQTNETSIEMVTQVTAENDDDYWFPPPDGCDTPAAPDEFEILDEFESLPAANNKVVGEVAGAPPASVGDDASASTVTPTQDLRRIEFTLFPSCRATRGERLSMSWPEARAWIAEPGEYGAKEDCPLALPGLNDKNTRERGAAFTSWGCVVVEHDAGTMGLQDAAQRLRKAGIVALMYTSASHKPESPRWRAILPVAKPVTSAAEYKRLVRVVNAVLDGVLAPESEDVGRGWFVGRVRGRTYEHLVVEGTDPIDEWVAVQELVDHVVELPLRERGEAKAKAKAKATPAPLDDDHALEREITLGRVDEEVLADVRGAIEFLASSLKDGSDWDRPTWIEIGHALKSLAQAGYEDEARAMWHEFSEPGNTYDPRECDQRWDGFRPERATYKSVLAFAQKKGWVNPKSRAGHLAASAAAGAELEDFSDAGNAAVLLRLVAGDLRYVPERKAWIWWTGSRWESDADGNRVWSTRAALRVADHHKALAADLFAKAQREDDDDRERKRLVKDADAHVKWARRCRDRAPIDNMLALAARDPRAIAPLADLDKDPWLLGVENGVVDLRTGQLRQAAREDFVTKRCPVSFDPDAKAPRWEKFIDEITGRSVAGAVGDYESRPALAGYLQRALGYSLTGSTAEHKLFIAVGAGSNGKSVLLDLVQWLLGDYCVTLPPEALMASKHDEDAERASPLAATLAGARMAISAESRDSQRMQGALIKRHTGGGFLTARRLHENPFRFEITHKLWLMTNHRPGLDRLDDALRGRLHMLPFDRRWNRPDAPNHDPALPDGDKGLLDALRAEAQGILAWLVRGAVAYQREGLAAPAVVLQAANDYFAEQDVLGRWLDERCERVDAKQGTAASRLFAAFCRWRDDEGESGGPSTQKAFSTELLARGVGRHITKGEKLYGLRLIGGDDVQEDFA